MPDNRDSPAGLFGLLGVGMAVCCRLPLLLGAGVAIGAAGLALGSGLVVALGAAAAVWGWRRHQRADHCDVPSDAPPVGQDHDSTRAN